MKFLSHCFLTTGFIIFSVFSFSFFVFSVGAATPEELKKSIEQKAQELTGVTGQIQENQQKLEAVQGEKQTLQKELNNAQSQIKQLDLSILSSKLTVEKLELEVESLQYDIGDAEKQIKIKRDALSAILRELQRKENEAPLIVFLKNKTLAESVFEIQSLNDFNNNLSLTITDLKLARGELNKSLDETVDKKQKREIENQNFKNKKIIVEEVKKDKQLFLAQTKNKETNYQKIVDDLEKRRLEISAEIEKVEEELRMKIDPTLLPMKRPGVLAWPVSYTRITQEYGATKFAQRNYAGKWHNGIDLGGPIGTPIMAAEKGEVIFVADQDNYLTNGRRLCAKGAAGKVIVIKHENNLTTLYGHLSLQVVKQGEKVQRGQLIGYLGKSGWATGPHLHFTVYATQTMPPARPGFPEGTKSSRVCGPMPVGGDLNPLDYL